MQEKQQPLTELPVGTPPDVSALLTELQVSLQAADNLNVYGRMELNHDARHCWWPGQTDDGRKWCQDEAGALRTLLPGQKPGEVFPWAGAADNRVPLVDEIIQERVMMQRLAYDRKEMRIGPRNLSPDDDPAAMAALWGQVAAYYHDIGFSNYRDAVAQWVDIAEEYGHAVMHIGWQSKWQAVERVLSVETLVQTLGTLLVARLEAQRLQAGAQPEESGASVVTEEEQSMLMEQAVTDLERMIQNAKDDGLVELVLQADPEMSRAEAKKLTSKIRAGKPWEYAVAEEIAAMPEWRALTPFLDVFYPVTTTRLVKAPWIAVAEWVTVPELVARIETEGYDAEWVEAVKSHPGRAFNLGGNRTWVMSSGLVRCPVEDTQQVQILHVYSRPTGLGKVQALYRTVVHPLVKDSMALHECCEYAHGEYPFKELMREPTKTMLVESRGVGEVGFTHQMEVKRQRDLRADDASLKIQPPLKVPLNRDGGRVDIRPGVQIPYRSNGGMGEIDVLRLPSDPSGSQEVEAQTRESLDRYFFRGPNVPPAIQLSWNQMLVSDFLASLREVRKQTFQLCQQFAPEEIKSSFVGGLGVDLNTTREEIQGQVSIGLEFDVSTLDPDMIEKKLGVLATMIRPLDNQGLLQTGPVLKACVAALFPGWYKLMVADPAAQGKLEAEDEKKVAGDMLNGLESDYVPGVNHQLRLQVLQGIFGIAIDKKGNMQVAQPMGKDGQMSKPQRMISEDADVGALVANRVKFHHFQIQQAMGNPATGRLGVEQVRG